jgi:hypothetical protein
MRCSALRPSPRRTSSSYARCWRPPVLRTCRLTTVAGTRRSRRLSRSRRPQRSSRRTSRTCTARHLLPRARTSSRPSARRISRPRRLNDASAPRNASSCVWLTCHQLQTIDAPPWSMQAPSRQLLERPSRPGRRANGRPDQEGRDGRRDGRWNQALQATTWTCRCIQCNLTMMMRWRRTRRKIRRCSTCRKRWLRLMALRARKKLRVIKMRLRIR